MYWPADFILDGTKIGEHISDGVAVGLLSTGRLVVEFGCTKFRTPHVFSVAVGVISVSVSPGRNLPDL